MHRRILERLHVPSTEGSGSLIAAMCINAFGAGLFFPFSFLYFTMATSLTVGQVGVILTTATLITLVVTPVTGALVDRLGSRRLVVTSQVIQAVGLGQYLVASSAFTLLLGALLVTSAARMFFASFSTMLAEQGEGADRDRWYGRVGVTENLASSMSGFLASLVIGSVGLPGFRAVIAFNAGCLIGSAVLLRRVPLRQRNETTSPDGGYRSVLKDRAFLRLVFANALFAVCSMLLGLGLAIYVTDALRAPLWTVGVLGVMQTGLVVGLQMRVLGAVEGIGRIRVMQFAGGLRIVACLLFAAAVLVPGAAVVPWLLQGAGCFTFAQMLYGPTARALAASQGPPELQGRYVATYEFSWGLAAAVSPALFGISYGASVVVPWLLMGALAAVAMLVLRSVEARMTGAVHHRSRRCTRRDTQGRRATSD